jgi:type II secretory pathway pseudopilin PulG
VNRNATTRRATRPGEEGYLLVAVMFLLAILVISMAVALPKVREDIQRDRDVETMRRGQQYMRAIRLYYRKFHAYPPSVDALLKTNEIRFLRKRYTDPVTGKDDWKSIQFGQNKTPPAMGFFGQPMMGQALAGTGPGSIAGASPIGSGSGSFMGGSSGGSSIFGSGSTGVSGAASGAGTGIGVTGATGIGSGATGSSATGGTDASGTAGISSNQTFGGGGIIGFSPGSGKQSILVYKKKDHYNEWEFLYSSQTDQTVMRGGNTGTMGTAAGSLNGTGTQAGTDGLSGNAPTTPTTPTAPSSPQQ